MTLLTEAFLRQDDFSVHRRSLSQEQRRHVTNAPTQDTCDIITAATRWHDAVWRDGHRYQKAGIMLGDFFSWGVAQLNLFDDDASRADSDALMALMDKLNRQVRRTQ